MEMENDSIIVCESLEQTKMFWKAYQHFFNTNKQPAFRQQEQGEPLDKFLYIKGHIGTYDKMRSNLKPLDAYKDSMVHSIIGAHHSKGISNTDKDILEKHLSSYNLGDSRNFESEDQLIDKLTKLRQAKLYLGSVCSWSRIAHVFGLSVIEI